MHFSFDCITWKKPKAFKTFGHIFTNGTCFFLYLSCCCCCKPIYDFITKPDHTTVKKGARYGATGSKDQDEAEGAGEEAGEES